MKRKKDERNPESPTCVGELVQVRIPEGEERNRSSI